jgi:hypothetical protein
VGVNCPWCGYTAVDITTSDDVYGFDQRPKFMCTNPVECHEWREGEGPAPEQEPLIILAR